MANTTIIVPSTALRLVAVRGLRLSGLTPTIAVTVGDTLNISGWDSGWPTGLITNVDESVADADGSTVSTSTASNTVTFDLTNSLFLTDAHTITAVDMVVRARVSITGGGVGSFDVSLLVGGISQGTVNIALTGAMTNVPASHVGWDQDWTAAQLDGAQVRVTSIEDTPTISGWFVDAIDVNIAFTAALTFKPAAIAPNPVLTGYAPVLVPSSDFKQARPPVVEVDLLGKAPVVDTAIAVGAGALNLTGQPSYLNPLTMQLQPNGWDNGWPNGFITNIDEPTSTPDGSVISTNVPSQHTFIDFDSVLGTIDPLDTVLGVEVVVRTAYTYTQPDPVTSTPRLSVTLYLDGIGYGLLSKSDQDVLTNQTYSMALWQQDWSIQQLEALQVRLSSSFWLKTADNDLNIVDGIDVLVTYAPQAPMRLYPGAGSLALSGEAPSLEDLRTERPLVGSATLAGKVPTLQRADTVYPSEDTLLTNAKIVVRRVDFIELPAIDALAISGKIPTTLVDHLAQPAVRTLALSGKEPVPDTTINHFAAPGTRSLLLFPQAPLVQTVGRTVIGPEHNAGVLAGKVPVVVPSIDVVREPAAAALSIATAAPSIDSPVLIPAGVSLSLTMLTPQRVPGTVIPMTAVSVALTGYLPALGPLEAQLAFTTYVPTATIDHRAQPAAAAITLLGRTSRVDNASRSPAVGTLAFTGYAPALSFSAGLSAGAPGLINLTVDRAVEFIATPTNILIG